MTKSKKQTKSKVEKVEFLNETEVKPLDLPILGENSEVVEENIVEDSDKDVVLNRSVRRAYHKMLQLPSFKKQFEAYSRKRFGK